MGPHVACIGEMKNAYTILVRKPEGKIQLRSLGTDWRVLLKWILKIGCEDVVWINLAQDRGHWRALVNIVMTLPVP
jgi:hypothetical protein